TAPRGDPERERPRPGAFLHRQSHRALPWIARLHAETDALTEGERRRDACWCVLMHLESRVVPCRDVVAEGGQEAHDVRWTAGDQMPLLANAAAAPEILGTPVARQRVDVEVALAVERHAGEDGIVEGPVDEIGEATLARREQHSPAPQDAGDRGTGLVVGEIVGELVRLAERLAQVARAEPHGPLHLVAHEG